ncbi:MAG: hypothetical protein HY966_08085 [Ignavibacteriales bacterium]|nr:hypothetical protein [Ignavibacteriales bacterium]
MWQSKDRSFDGDTLRLVRLGFDRTLNTFHWDGAFLFGVQSDLVKLSTKQTLRSRVIRSDIRSLQDEYVGKTQIAYGWKENWEIRSLAISSVLSDNRSIDLSRLSQHQFLAGLGAQPERELSFEALAGWELNSQENVFEQGPIFALHGEGSKWRFEELHLDAQAVWTQTNLKQRRPYDGGVRVTVRRDFGNQAGDSLVFRFNTQRRDLFINAESRLQNLFQIQQNVFRRALQEFEVGNYLTFMPVESMNASLGASLTGRTIERGVRYKDYDSPTIQLDNRIRDLTLNLRALIVWSGWEDWLSAEVDMAHIEHEERHTVVDDSRVSSAVAESQAASARRLEHISKWTSIATRLWLFPSRSDSFNIQSSVSILRYDTPDTTNTDDRDEFLMAGGISYTHLFSRSFSFFASIDANVSHLVYIHRAQSASNVWNRTIRLSAGSAFRPSAAFFTRNTAEVTATYAVYDFEEALNQVQSFSFRQARWIDSTVVTLSRRIQLDFLGSLRLFQRGALRWKEFTERPENEYEELAVWPQVHYRWGAWEFGVGLRLFQQSRYTFDQSGQRRFEQVIRSLGPTASIRYAAMSGIFVLAEGWREQQSVNSANATAISNLTCQIGVQL